MNCASWRTALPLTLLCGYLSYLCEPVHSEEYCELRPGSGWASFSQPAHGEQDRSRDTTGAPPPVGRFPAPAGSGSATRDEASTRGILWNSCRSDDLGSAGRVGLGGSPLL